MQRHGGALMEHYNKGLLSVFRKLIDLTDPMPTRPGLAASASRAARAWAEYTSGYAVEPEKLLKDFEDGAESYDNLVIVHNIPIYSLCEHHLAPITGIAHIGYLPFRSIVGLSKLVRVADAYARRLQVQERITTQIADCVHKTLNARATGVLLRARHGCMDARGVKCSRSVTTTSAMLGLLRDETALRAEFMQACIMAERGVENGT